ADVGVGLVTEPVRAPAEQLGRGPELGVDLEADHRLVGGRRRHAAASSTRAAAKRRGSARAGPSSCTPTGRPSAPAPNGTVMAASPERFVGIVKTSERYIDIGSAVFAPSSNAVVGAVAPRRASHSS